ncbi:MAG: hypothetical protein AAB666_02240, partial [Patescibacteria group bacterium]
MRRRIKIVIFVLAVIVSSALFVSRAFVYDTNIAHPGLTKLAGELYNQQGGQLTNQEIKWLMQGAIEEDTPFRWMNHFYDPVHNVGLKYSYDTAKIWAGNASNQASYSKGDQTWQRAIYYWQTGDKEKAMIALGHVLHLLEDMTVPAHTRDDGHPEGDPYEVWVKNNFKAINGEWIYFNKLDKYFDYLANYSNNNFYSEDTIESKKFSVVTIVSQEIGLADDGEKHWFVNSKDKDEGKYPLFLYKSIVLPWKQDVPQSNWLKTVNDSFILSSHFSLLAPKAIGAGAGAIKLFFEETQKQQAFAKPFWQINPLGIAQGETVGTAENLAQIYQNMSGQLGNLWDAGKKFVWNVGDAQTTYDFFIELFATNIVLAQELKNLQQTGQNLAAVPIKIVAETGKAIEEAIRDSSASPQNDQEATQSNIGEIASSPVAPRNDNVPQNDIGGDLLSGFAATPTVTFPESEIASSPVAPRNDNKVAYSGGGSSWSSSAPAQAASAPSSDSLPAG